MEGLEFLLDVLKVLCFLTAPVALVVAITALRRNRENLDLILKVMRSRGLSGNRELESRLQKGVVTPPVPRVRPAWKGEQSVPDSTASEIGAEEVPMEPVEEAEDVSAAAAVSVGPAVPVVPAGPAAPVAPAVAAPEDGEGWVDVAAMVREKARDMAKVGSLEQRIGTQWVLIAGVIAVIFGVVFFLKYAYDNDLVGPLGRVIIAAIAGLVALVAGEITRRRDYGIVAKGVTAMGFAILYAASFSAYRLYGLIEAPSAFGLAVVVTAAAMVYAVRLDEVMMAALALVGGFLTPVIASTGENRPMGLFSYVLVLGTGAMLCACYRKWRTVNAIAFLGTYVLYVGWFEKFFRPELELSEGMPEQTAIAMGWLGVFFAVYLVLPLLNGLVRKVRAQQEDVWLVLANAAVVFYHFWVMLFDDQRDGLACVAIGMCVAHLVMMWVVNRRSRDDLNLQIALLVTGLFFVTIAVPLYLRMYSVAMVWAAEAVVVAVIGMRYRSVVTQVVAAVVGVLAVGQLLYQLPMHEESFRLVLNAEFGAWVFVVAAVVVGHVLYRRNEGRDGGSGNGASVGEVLYSAAALLLMAAVMLEWYWHCEYNIAGSSASESRFLTGMMVIFGVFAVLTAVRPLRPVGEVCYSVATFIAMAGAVFTVISFPGCYSDRFVIFANYNFGMAVLLVVALFGTAWAIRASEEEAESRVICSTMLSVTGIIVLFVLLTEQVYLYWYCKDRYGAGADNWQFLANMHVSVMWAAYGAALTVVRPLRSVGQVRNSIATFIAMAGAVFVVISSPGCYSDRFVIFANYNFGMAVLLVVALFGTAWMMRNADEEEQSRVVCSSILSMAGVVVLWLLLTEQVYLYWYCRNRFGQSVDNWKFLANMYISVTWAVYGAALTVVGFWRKSNRLRYVSLGLFGLLLAKVFIVDTSTVKHVYRIAAFLATGATLVGVSYLYQFLKKSGFFESIGAGEAAGRGSGKAE